MSSQNFRAQMITCEDHYKILCRWCRQIVRQCCPGVDKSTTMDGVCGACAGQLPQAIDLVDMVRQFHAKVGQIDAAAPDISEHRELRISLITEEFRELREALEANDISGVAHELADVLYVVIGSALQWGIPIERVFGEVHRSNMTKEGDAKRADGKILKGPNYSPPNISAVLSLGEM